MSAHKLQIIFDKLSSVSFFIDSAGDETELIDVNQRNWADDYPLHLCIRLGEVDDVVTLLENGANVNARGEDGITPLHCAAIKNHIEIAKILLAAGADPSAVNDDGRTPVDWANTGGNPEMVKLLRYSVPPAPKSIP